MISRHRLALVAIDPAPALSAALPSSSATSAARNEGYDLVCAADGRAAWEIASTDPTGFAVMIVDRFMPEMDGIERRMAAPGLGARRCAVSFRRGAGLVTVTIEDEGAGFDWRAFVDYDPLRAFDPNGRGIAIARAMSFDRVAYNERGNRVTVEVDAAPASSGPTSGELRLSLLP